MNDIWLKPACVFIPDLHSWKGFRGAYLFSVIHYNQEQDVYVVCFVELLTGCRLDRPLVIHDYKRNGDGSYSYNVDLEQFEPTYQPDHHRFYPSMKEFLLGVGYGDK